MVSTKNQFKQVTQRIILSLAKQVELAQHNQALEKQIREIEVRLENLTKEIKILAEENSDFKEIVYELHHENLQLKKLIELGSQEQTQAES